MRLLTTAIAAAGMLAATGLASPRAEAMTVTSPAGLAAAIEQTSLAQDVAYGCRPVWRCGYYGCGWRRACFWRPGPYWGPGYGYYRPYRPYWAWRWNHRRWW